MSDIPSTAPVPSTVSHARMHPWTRRPILRLAPGDRQPSPPPGKDVDRPAGSGWDPDPSPPFGGDNILRPAPRVDPVWSHDANDYAAGWLRADSVAAAMVFNAAYDHALQWGDRFRRLDLRWHREDEYNVNMYGRGPRGYIAPDEVHGALDRVLARHPALANVENELLHSRLDLYWLRHSRSPFRLPVALRDLRLRSGVLTTADTTELAQVMFEHCLVDFREVMICVDPRASVIYGRTRGTDGTARRWWSFGPRGIPAQDRRPADPRDDQRSEVSGSSDDDDDDAAPPPYSISRLERAVQLHRHAGRDYERVMADVDNLRQYIASLRQEARTLREECRRRQYVREELTDRVRHLRIEQEGTPEPPF